MEHSQLLTQSSRQMKISGKDSDNKCYIHADLQPSNTNANH